jgi:hypothetical protein
MRQTLTAEITKCPKPAIMSMISSFYIYSDIIDTENVGDAVVPLLRSICAKGSNGEIVNEKFERLYYKRVNRNSIQSIEIQINTPSGDRMKFEYGSVICVLQFRRASLL